MTARGRSWVLCEPQCWGFEHAPFNAALLETVAQADPEAKLLFLGEGEHLERTRQVLTARGRPDRLRVEWQQIGIPGRKRTGWARLRSEEGWCARALNEASSEGVQALIFCSMTATGLLALKKSLRAWSARVPVLAVLHSVLQTLEGPWPRRVWNWPLRLRPVLRQAHPRQLSYIALGEPIYASLARVMPEIVDRFKVLDHPYLMSRQDAAPPGIPPVRFGYFGTASPGIRGFETFARLADEIATRSKGQPSDFCVVGFWTGAPDELRARYPAVRETPQAPLSIEEYARQARSVTYAVGTADPAHYRLTASGSFLDALCYAKPCIYLRNPYVDYYAQRMGDIGYLCESYEALRDLAFSLVEHFPEDRYRHQVKTIQEARRLFEPASLAPRLRAMVNEARARLDA